MPDLAAAPATLLIVALLAYLLGSVPFGIVMARLFGLGDLRKIGSGSIGATNVLRTGNKLAAILTLLGDAGKGGVAVLLAQASVGRDAAQVAALAALLGHAYSVFLRFRGGKSVATGLGIFAVLSPPMALGMALAWVGTAAALRISSLAALVACAAAPVLAVWLAPDTVVLTVVLAGLIVAFHHSNIRRLLAGTEPRIGRSRT
ncbi:glycerol-3-phosphate 1-O-acyltransferase PlsY [Jannaschia sp. LMIT008]|uniref:glycerol-3-phosphate 1-O-acyltransferase PlsY n=1 Tax=Jannaschia maritima TaxID=3032585 RepID=UPI002811F142|nr:glycerol-3-phosphate 1-O-acyltransferase PlsY [Jannaschia sp. LMIT008]